MDQRKYNRAEKCAAILKFLKEKGVPPFFATAAERAGVNRATARGWLREGTDPPKADQPISMAYLEMNAFALEVRRIQADWAAQQLKNLAEGKMEDNERKEKAKHLIWLLSMLDGESFDPPKKVANVLKDARLPGDEPPPPEEPTLDDIAAAAAELAKAQN